MYIPWKNKKDTFLVESTSYANDLMTILSKYLVSYTLFDGEWWHFNMACRYDNAFIRQWTMSLSVQLLACCLFGAKRLMACCQLDPWRESFRENGVRINSRMFLENAFEYIICNFPSFLKPLCVISKRRSLNYICNSLTRTKINEFTK